MAEHPLGATIAGILLFTVGLALGGGLIYLNVQERERFADWSRAEGTVTEVLRHTSPSGDVFLPRVVFTTKSGTRVSFTLPAARRSPYAVNDTVPVLYLDFDPKTAIVEDVSRRRIRNVAGAAAALMLVCLGGYVAWYASRFDRITQSAKS